MRPGVRLAVDVGSVRVGVDRCDPDGVLATPLETLRRDDGDLAALIAYVAALDPVEVVVGLPVALDGTEGPAAKAVRAYAGTLQATLGAAGHGVTLRLVDERLSTAAAAKGLRSAGRDSRRGRPVIDQAAAVEILQGALDTERATGRPPGRTLRAARPRRERDAGRTTEPPTAPGTDEDRP